MQCAFRIFSTRDAVGFIICQHRFTHLRPIGFDIKNLGLRFPPRCAGKRPPGFAIANKGEILCHQ